MALIVRKTDSAANQHQTLIRVELSLPSPFKHLTLSRETVSWGRRVMMALQERFPTEHFSFTGKTLFVCNPATSQFIRDTNEAAATVMKINDSESLEDESVRLEMHEHLRSVVVFRIKFFAQFGVSTGVELDQKSRWLHTLKGQALMAYFSKEGFDMRRKIDKAILKASTKALSFAEEDHLDQYWAPDRRLKLCPHHHVKLENELVQLFTKYLSEAVKKVNRRRTYGARLNRALSNATMGVRQELLDKLIELNSKDSALEWHYQILKCDLLAEPLINYVLRKLLRPLIAKTPTKILKIAERKKAENREEIAACESELQSLSCGIDPEIIKNKMGTPTLAPEMIETILLVNTRNKKIKEQRLRELKAKTPEDFLREAQKEWGYNEAEMRKALPKGTCDHDRVVQAMMVIWDRKKDPHVLEEKNAFDPDLALDLDHMVNPLQYFEELYRKRDIQALALLHGKVEQIG